MTNARHSSGGLDARRRVRRWRCDVGSCSARPLVRRISRSPANLGCNPVTVGKWRTRFAAKRLDGLIDEPRPGQPRKITDEIVEQVIVTTLETTPDDGSTQWSTRSMAAKVGLNQTAVSRIWRTFGLKPHRIEDFKLSTDPQFIDKVRDVVGLVPEPARRGGGVVRRRKDSGASTWIAPRRCCRCCPARRPGRATPTSATAPRTSTRRSTCASGKVITADDRPAPSGRVPGVLEPDRPDRARRTRRARDLRQRLHPQSTRDPTLAETAPPLHAATTPRPTAHGSTRSNAGSPS